MRNVFRAAILAAAALLFCANIAAAAAPAQNTPGEPSRELVALVRFGSPRVAGVRALLDRGANVNARDAEEGSRATVLSWACYINHHEIAALLLERRADPNAPDANGQTPLATAVVFGDVPLVKMLLARGAKIARSDGGTVLLNACEAVNLPVVAYLRALRPAPNLNAETRDGETALSAACGQNANIVRLPQDDPAYERKRVAFVRDLLRWGARARNKRGESPGLVAGLWSAGIVRALLAAGANPDTRDAAGLSALTRACSGDEADPACARLLLRAGARVNRPDMQGRTALMAAAEAGDLPLTRLLLDRGADPNRRSQSGDTALGLARAAGHSVLVRLLESHRAAAGGAARR